MIERINTSSSMLFISNGSSSGPNIDMSAPSSGMVRYNTANSCLEVFDGQNNIWQTIKGVDATINLDYNVEKAMKWAIDRMKEEEEWQKVAATNKSAAVALENLNKAREQMRITSYIAKENNETTS
jgi:hypothetical protein